MIPYEQLIVRRSNAGQNWVADGLQVTIGHVQFQYFPVMPMNLGDDWFRPLNNGMDSSSLKRHQSARLGVCYLRSLLIHGARSVIRTAAQKEDRLSQWVTALAARRHANVAAVALANKTARIAWAMLRHNTDYAPDRAV